MRLLRIAISFSVSERRFFLSLVRRDCFVCVVFGIGFI